MKKSFVNAFFVAIYVALVAFIMNNGEKLFGNIDNSFFGPFAMLMLLVVSAAICGYLVFGQAVIMYLDGKKKEAVSMAGQTIGWLAGITVIVLIVLSVIK